MNNIFKFSLGQHVFFISVDKIVRAKIVECYYHNILVSERNFVSTNTVRYIVKDKDGERLEFKNEKLLYSSREEFNERMKNSWDDLPTPTR